ncbi:MAG: hypothetical protein QOE68_1067, partial [Thermoanaerobaculia bacterium]|nr:hypothetical protein [Thermoanaerobaculia bacterium]
TLFEPLSRRRIRAIYIRAEGRVPLTRHNFKLPSLSRGCSQKALAPLATLFEPLSRRRIRAIYIRAEGRVPLTRLNFKPPSLSRGCSQKALAPLATLLPPLPRRFHLRNLRMKV